MKKSLFLLAFLLLAGHGFSQIVDSAAVAKQVDSLIQVSRGLTDKREFDKALEVSGVAEKLALEKFGRESVPYANVCANQGRVYHFNNEYPTAEKWLQQALVIRERLLGKEHPDYAAALNALGNLYRGVRNFVKAEPVYAEALVVRKKVLGPMNIEYARSLNNLGTLYRDMGKYEQAEPLLLESKNIREKTVGKNHADYALCLKNLGGLYDEMGRFEQAELLLLESLSIREKTVGKEHKSYAESLDALANVYTVLGKYEQAELLFIEAKNVFEKTIGKGHEDYASSLHNLGLVYLNMGIYAKAELYFQEAIAVWEKTLTKSHPFYASGLSSLASVYYYQGNYEKAKMLALEVASIKEKILGKEHPQYGRVLANLASLHGSLGEFKEAEPLFLEAKHIIENAYGKAHPEYAESLGKLALLYRKMGDLQKAEPLFLEAMRITRESLGKQHEDYANCLDNLASFYLVSDLHAQAAKLYDEAATVQQNQISKALHHLSERETGNYLQLLSSNQDRILSLAWTYPATLTAFNNALFYKGFLLNAYNQVKHLALRDSAATETFYRLKAYNRRLATEYAKPIAERKGVEELEAQANDLEKELTRTVSGYGEALRQVKWQEVQAALKPGEAAIEFVHYKFWNKKQTDSVMYAALVLLPGAEPPQFIPLFEEKQLESLLQRGTEPYEVHIKTLYAHTPSGTGKSQKSLYQLLWQPLEAVLGTTKTVCFSPSGLLHRLSLAAVPTSATATLADRHTLVELGSTRSLAVASPSPGALGEADLFGGIQYDMDSTAVIQANAALPTETPTGLRRTLSFSQTDSTLRGGSWKYLPGSEKEVTDAEKIMQESGLRAHTLRGYAATEEAFKSIGSNAGRVSNPSSVPTSPRILHLATHGFFFPDPKTEVKGEGLRSDGSDPVFKMSDNPLIRAGLIMAGGNHAWKTGQPLKPGMDDGILTAYEISQMNLSNTELVVLSACETGLGDIQGNEGVYGLQRAFKIAGAKYVIMSLWQVPDKQTARLMTIFYKKWLTEKMAVPEAFRAAQNELRGRGFDPFYWAGFVLVE